VSRCRFSSFAQAYMRQIPQDKNLTALLSAHLGSALTKIDGMEVSEAGSFTIQQSSDHSFRVGLTNSSMTFRGSFTNTSYHFGLSCHFKQPTWLQIGLGLNGS